MKVETFFFSDCREEPYDRISVGEVVVFDDYQYSAIVDAGVVSAIEVDPKNPKDALVTISYDPIATATRRASDFHIGKMKKVRNIDHITNYKEEQ